MGGDQEAGKALFRQMRAVKQGCGNIPGKPGHGGPITPPWRKAVCFSSSPLFLIAGNEVIVPHKLINLKSKGKMIVFPD